MPSPTYAELGVQAVGLSGWALMPGMRLIGSDGMYPYRVLSVSPFCAFAIINGQNNPAWEGWCDRVVRVTEGGSKP